MNLMAAFVLEVALITIVVSILAYYMIYMRNQNVKIKKKIENTRATLVEAKKQVKLMHGYNGFADSRVLLKLLKEGSITANLIDETDKVILQFQIIDDEGCSFIKTLEFDTGEIIFDIEII